MNEKHVLTAILGPGPQGPEADGADELEIIANELIEAIHAKDVEGTVAALHAAFECLDSAPHVEGPHEPSE